MFQKRKQSTASNVYLTYQFSYIGIEVVDPILYQQIYGKELIEYEDMPQLAKQILAPEGEKLAIHTIEELPILYGDVWALSLIDVKQAGMEFYADQLKDINGYFNRNVYF